MMNTIGSCSLPRNSWMGIAYEATICDFIHSMNDNECLRVSKTTKENLLKNGTCFSILSR